MREYIRVSVSSTQTQYVNRAGRMNEPEHDGITAETTKPPGKRADRSWIAFGIAGLAVGLAASLAVGWAAFPKLLYSELRQPIDFNHKIHVEQVGDCAGCHSFDEEGRFSGIPDLSNCIQCHSEAQGTDPNEAKLVADYVTPSKPIPWLVYSRQPQCAFFSHSAHVFSEKMQKMAGMKPGEAGEDPGAYSAAVCVNCHGKHGETEHSRPFFRNRITGESRDIYGKNISGFADKPWDRMKMDTCADCHAKVKNEKEACFVCHK